MTSYLHMTTLHTMWHSGWEEQDADYLYNSKKTLHLPYNYVDGQLKATELA